MSYRIDFEGDYWGQYMNVEHPCGGNPDTLEDQVSHAKFIIAVGKMTICEYAPQSVEPLLPDNKALRFTRPDCNGDYFVTTLATLIVQFPSPETIVYFYFDCIQDQWGDTVVTTYYREHDDFLQGNDFVYKREYIGDGAGFAWTTFQYGPGFNTPLTPIKEIAITSPYIYNYVDELFFRNVEISKKWFSVKVTPEYIEAHPGERVTLNVEVKATPSFNRRIELNVEIRRQGSPYQGNWPLGTMNPPFPQTREYTFRLPSFMPRQWMGSYSCSVTGRSGSLYAQDTFKLHITTRG